MPIYEYRCGSCGFEKEYLQKISEAPMKTCPSCGQDALIKLVSAAGFQLKGSGWYATDFKGSKSTQTKAETPAATGKGESSESAPPASAGHGCCGNCSCAK